MRLALSILPSASTLQRALSGLSRRDSLDAPVLRVALVFIDPLKEIDPRATPGPQWTVPLPRTGTRVNSSRSSGTNGRTERCRRHRAWRVEIRILAVLRAAGIVISCRCPRRLSDVACGFFEDVVNWLAKRFDLCCYGGKRKVRDEIERVRPLLYLCVSRWLHAVQV